jgi:heptose-I-phosphate ethanolaminephosphotransferase
MSLLCSIDWRFISKKYHVVDFYRAYYEFTKEQSFNEINAARNNLIFNDKVITELKIKQPKTFVIILGESLSRSHMQLYGYTRETNPELTSIKKQLYIFKDVISPATTTIEAMRFILTLANHQNPNFFLVKRSIINLFNEIGYDTIWIGNQNFRGIDLISATESLPASVPSHMK